MNSGTNSRQTAWGDAEGRHRDILASAEDLLAESGYSALTMRAIAAGAGVSSGTVYQYFTGKEDVFAALMARRLDSIRETLENVDRRRGVAGVLSTVLPQITEMWERLGRSAPQWEAKVLAEGRRSKGLMSSAAVYRKTIDALGRTLAEAAAASDQVLLDAPAVPFWVWDSLIGLSDDLLHGGAAQGGVRSEELIEFATTAIQRSIVVPA
ncbi:TetR/AcrR family transcriptional regulator [Pseudonocardia spinosispora]|uniref:TetR/AcrR family transcriptional regulator n=1 Tax=Pseudonocardia spinosispora TaxID=103441 RepID=UPI00146FBCC7|nr:TetR/AcrR family transcriptional regulator [Pseudonocardia spinosispora]